MKHQVSDEAVAEYAKRLRCGEPLGRIFPGKLAECEFTESQRQTIRAARHAKKDLLKKVRSEGAVAVESQATTTTPVAPQKCTENQVAQKGLKKLERILYLQGGRCFFCGEPMQAVDASIEHLHPKSRGGKSTEDNEVVCHKSLNATFGALDLKRKFEFVLKSAGSFRCPKN